MVLINGFHLCYFNWFKSAVSRKKNLPLWSLVYKCIKQECNQSINTFIRKINKDKVIVQILYLNKEKHQKISKRKRIIS